MAHLTKYTYSKLCQALDIDVEIDFELFINHIYNDAEIYFMMNKLELKYLFNYKNILEDEDKYKAEYYKFIPPKADSKEFVFDKGGKPKYHLSVNCLLIKKDYVDFFIPQEVRAEGDELIEEYRQWFKAQSFAERYFKNEIKQGEIARTYDRVFAKKHNLQPIGEEFKLIIEKPNSNHIVTEESFNHELFLMKLEQLKEEYAYHFSCKTTRTMFKFTYLLKKSDEEIIQKTKEVFSTEFINKYKMENFKSKLHTAKRIKDDVITNLLDYFKWTFKLNQKDFNPITLDYFGLQCCGNCYKQAHESFISGKN